MCAVGCGNGCGEGSWILIVLMFESCVVDFLCPRDAIAGRKLARILREPQTINTTYLLWLRFILCWIEFLGLLGVVRYFPLALAELLCLVFRLAGLLLR